MSSPAPSPAYHPLVVHPPAYRPRIWLPALLLAATALTTLAVGARLQYNFLRGRPAYFSNTDLLPFAWIWRHRGFLRLGIPFSAALLAILLAHELGHYLACRHYQLAATLPHFIPAPTLIGTMGAFIAIRSPFRNRRELFDVGVAGPLAGFVLAAPIFIYGLLHSPLAAGGGADGQAALRFGWPPLVLALADWLRPGASLLDLRLSPIARAGWVGLLVTMLNLIPSGQLDGGHLLYTFFPRAYRWVSWVAIVVVAVMGWRYWQGWYLWAVVLLAMRGRHPFVPPDEPVGGARIALAVAALLVLAVTFIATPFILT